MIIIDLQRHPNQNDDGDLVEEEDDDHGLPYNDEDEDVVDLEEEIGALKLVQIEKGSNGKICINLNKIGEGEAEEISKKCCCGRNDKFHEDKLHLKMDHICRSCSGSCYGLCTEEYVCYKCLYM